MKLIPNAISSGVARQALRLEGASPSLLFAVGVGGFIATTVLASRASMKLPEVMAKVEHEMETIDRTADQASQMEDVEYKNSEISRDKGIVLAKGTGEIVKLYAPTVVVGVISIAALTKSHRILTSRNVALTAAYGAVEQAFKSYRGRVVEKYGEQQDREFMHETELYEQVNDDGELTHEVRATLNGGSQYAKWFTRGNANWNSDPEINLLFLRCQQQWANDMLNVKGHVFLNEVYDHLGIERTPEGAVVGWVKGEGDSYIDLGIWGPNTHEMREFYRQEEGILLDFNVDGLIWDKIGAKS